MVEGYARASYEKGFSAVRVPWVAKNPKLDNNFEGDPVNDTKDFLRDKFLWRNDGLAVTIRWVA